MTALTCSNEDRHTGVRAVAKLTYPDGRYRPETACAGCLYWSIQNARDGLYPITIEPLRKPERRQP